jgi:hypothetical protein
VKSHPRHVPLLPSLPPAARFVLAGLVVACLAYLVASLERTEPTSPTTAPEPEVAVPELDHKVLATARDDTREHRLQVEPEPLRHLLATAIDVGPTVANALGMPAEPVPLDDLRKAPANWRGRWLFYEGTIEHLSGPREGHPIDGRSIYEATLRLRSGDAVLAAFSMPPQAPLAVGSWARAEGFLLKLRDATYPTPIDLAPMLVGRELQRDYERWPPVTTLDTNLLATVDDASFAVGAPVWRTIDEDQHEPLWHLGAFVRDTGPQRSLAEWRKIGTLNNELHKPLREGKVARGQPVRVFGSLILRRTVAAAPNPAGIQHWTAAWLQVREYSGGSLVPVWVPKRVAELPERVQLEVRGYYYRWAIYETHRGESRWAPLFVAADLDPYQLDTGLGLRSVAPWLAGIGCAFLSLIVVAQWRARRAADAHTRALFELRRRQRAHKAAAAGAKPASPRGEH